MVGIEIGAGTGIGDDDDEGMLSLLLELWSLLLWWILLLSVLFCPRLLGILVYVMELFLEGDLEKWA